MGCGGVGVLPTLGHCVLSDPPFSKRGPIASTNAWLDFLHFPDIVVSSCIMRLMFLVPLVNILHVCMARYVSCV